MVCAHDSLEIFVLLLFDRIKQHRSQPHVLYNIDCIVHDSDPGLVMTMLTLISIESGSYQLVSAARFQESVATHTYTYSESQAISP